MTSVHTPLQPYVAQFFSTWLFKSVPEADRKAIASQLQLCSFRPGSVIYSDKELPSQVHYLIQGRVRILGPEDYDSPTVEVAEPGAILGWDSLLRRVSSGSVRAAIRLSPDQAEPGVGEQDVLTLALPADTFETLVLKYLMPTLGEHISSVELFDTLARLFDSLPTRLSQINLKELVQFIEREQLATINHIFPKSLKSNSLLNSQRQNYAALPPDWIWLLSGGDRLPVTPGTVIRSIDQLYSDSASRFPIRLIGIDRNFIAAVVLKGQIPAAYTAQPPALPAAANEATAPSAVPATTIDSVAQPVSLPAAADAIELALLPATVTPPTPDYPTPDYAVWRSAAADPIEDIVACLGMVCSWFRVPYRPDFLRQWLKRRSLDQWDGFEVCVRVAEAIGLQAEVVNFTPSAGGLNRLPTPCLIQCQQILVVLYEVTPTRAIVASPRTGLLHLTPKQLASRLEKEGSGQTANQRAIVLDRLPNSPTKQFGFQWFLPVLLTQRGILFQVLIASLFVQLLTIINPLLVQQIVDNVIIAGNPDAMTAFGALMLLCAFFEAGLSVLRMYLFASTANRVDLHLGIEIVRHLLHLPLNFFEKRPVGELSARLSELENIRQFLTSTALTVVLDVVFSLLYIAVMFLYSSRLALCVLLSVPAIVLSTLLVSAIQKKLIRIKSDHHSRVQSYLVEVLGGIFTVKAQHIEPLVEATWRDRYVQYLASGFKTVTVGTLFSSFTSFLNTLSSLLVLWVGADLVLRGELTLGGLIAFRILAGYVTAPMLRLAGLWQRFQETSLSMELLADIADFPAEEMPHQGRLKLPAIQGHVQYDDVSFSFRPGSPQLVNVSLQIPPGSFVGIVGQSGSGKSTLMKLLPRLYQPQMGRIYLDGYDVSKVSLDSLRHQVGIVPQDAVLFEGTIRDNIALFEPMSDDAIIEAATVAEAHDFIMQLPEGYSTPVGERGGSLSGGQRQRIAIARVVARNPRLLIFDEATSALDYETEKRVCENLMRRFRDRTCFFITHRLNTITNADWILLMQSGMLAEQGTHQQLVVQRQLYYSLFMQQSRS